MKELTKGWKEMTERTKEWKGMTEMTKGQAGYEILTIEVEGNDRNEPVQWPKAQMVSSTLALHIYDI